jgi:hypothetical protein
MIRVGINIGFVVCFCRYLSTLARDVPFAGFQVRQFLLIEKMNGSYCSSIRQGLEIHT